MSSKIVEIFSNSESKEKTGKLYPKNDKKNPHTPDTKVSAISLSWSFDMGKSTE